MIVLWAAAAAAILAAGFFSLAELSLVSAGRLRLRHWVQETIRGGWMSREILDRGQQLHAEMARLSTRGRHVIVAASHHMSLLTEREHAQRVAELLGEVIAEAATSHD